MSPIAFAVLFFNIIALDILLVINYTILQWDFEMGAESKLVNPFYTPLPYNEKGYTTFEDFYPFYLGEHNNQICRRMHIIGTTNSVAMLGLMAATGFYPLFGLALAQGYGMAWVGHFFFEKNKPATFSHPIYSFMGDFRLLWEVISGKRKF